MGLFIFHDLSLCKACWEPEVAIALGHKHKGRIRRGPEETSVPACLCAELLDRGLRPGAAREIRDLELHTCLPPCLGRKLGLREGVLLI